MKTCENCKNEHDGTYGSGRFCSLKCSRGFSTKAKRMEINEKVTKTCKEKKRENKIICGLCGIEFVNRRKRKFCSTSCASKNNWKNPLYYENMQMKIALMDRTSFSFGAISSIFLFDGYEIKCQSKKEFNALEKIINIFLQWLK
jgi:hypothetical protein